jgi:hypothetical protein
LVTLSKIFLYVWLVVLLVALAKMGSAQPMPDIIGTGQREIAEPEIGPDEDRGMQRAGAPPSGVPVGMLISEQGVILEDNRSYALRIIVECLMPMEPGRVQKLLASNRSLEEIREAIGGVKGETIYQGSMKLDEKIYPLINIRIAPLKDNASILEAEVAKPIRSPAPINEITVVGYIRMIIEPSEDEKGMMGTGELQMNNSYFGKYIVMLDRAPPLQENKSGYEDMQMQMQIQIQKDMQMQKSPGFPAATFSQSQGGQN